MNKKIVYLVILVSLFGLVSLVSAAGIPLENPLGATRTFPALLDKIIIAVAEVVGVLSVLMFIVAGIFFVTSAGEPAKVTRAKDALKYAIMGAVVALAAGGLVALVKTIIGVP
jgi:hypothetical protein